MIYAISLGREGPTDSCLKLNDKEFLIETVGWQMLDVLWNDASLITQEDIKDSFETQRLLGIIYDNHEQLN